MDGLTHTRLGQLDRMANGQAKAVQEVTQLCGLARTGDDGEEPTRGRHAVGLAVQPQPQQHIVTHGTDANSASTRLEAVATAAAAAPA
eukprot:CAMPEP_0177686724 /NCGR_PEP_ID=MMETSP0447-20121125/33725_1 /TAXON_ID=0 /ORGANISM="Stygamoeba regulata, Strain BSH-02190019" /LENGTH=87 /DNA_ID=CAMNT_0019196873 /DNA_START=148 /DNA_END=409 /DNA_ORIENTATION=+